VGRGMRRGLLLRGACKRRARGQARRACRPGGRRRAACTRRWFEGGAPGRGGGRPPAARAVAPQTRRPLHSGELRLAGRLCGPVLGPRATLKAPASSAPAAHPGRSGCAGLVVPLLGVLEVLQGGGATGAGSRRMASLCPGQPAAGAVRRGPVIERSRSARIAHGGHEECRRREHGRSSSPRWWGAASAGASRRGAGGRTGCSQSPRRLDSARRERAPGRDQWSRVCPRVGAPAARATAMPPCCSLMILLAPAACGGRRAAHLNFHRERVDALLVGVEALVRHGGWPRDSNSGGWGVGGAGRARRAGGGESEVEVCSAASSLQFLLAGSGQPIAPLVLLHITPLISRARNKSESATCR
jgi:hypothetical protein